MNPIFAIGIVLCGLVSVGASMYSAGQKQEKARAALMGGCVQETDGSKQVRDAATRFADGTAIGDDAGRK